jgi:nucleoside-diphosphate-sugar epimerase
VERTQIAVALPSPVLVLGATSIVGQFLLARLREVHIEILAASRNEQTPCTGVKWITADVTTPRLELPANVPLVFSISPIWILPQALPSLKAAGMSRLIAFSSTSRFTKQHSAVAAEREVAVRLAEAEDETRSYCETQSIAWTILRPTLIYAEGQDRSVTRLARLIRRVGFLPLSGDGSGKRQPVHAADLAAGAIAAALSPLTENRAYNLPGGEALSYRVMAERIFQGLGRKPRILSIPPQLWRLGLTLASPVLRGATTAMGSRMAEDLTFDPTQATSDFNWRPRAFHPRFLEMTRAQKA